MPSGSQFDNLATLSAIKSFYQDGNDLIGVFSNLVLTVLSDKNKLNIEQIQNKLADDLSIEIPLDPITSFVKRLRKKNLVRYTRIKEDILLTQEGIILKKDLKENLVKKRRSHNYLLGQIKQYFESRSKNSQQYEISELGSKFSIFIQQNISSSSLLLAGETIDLSLDNETNNLFIDFIIEAEKSNPEHFDLLKSVIFGGLILKLLSNKKFYIEGKQIKKLDVYLDTNFMFGVFNLNEDMVNKAAQELLQILKDFKINLKIFSFTKTEIINTLKNIIRKFDYYPSNIAVDSISSSLKRAGFSKNDLILLIEKLDKNLDAMDIEIDFSYELNNFVLGKEDEFSDFKKATDKNNKHVALHDFSAIEAIKIIRHSQTTGTIENCKAIFLTSDFSFYRSILETEPYNSRDLIPEIIYKSDLASLLWLKNPKLSPNVLANDHISSYITNDLISSGLWDYFIDSLKSSLQKGTIEDGDAELIISSNETEKLLKSVQLKDKTRNDIPIFIENEIKKIKKTDIKKDKKIYTLQNENEEMQNELITKINQLTSIKNSINKECILKISLLFNILIWFSSIALMIILIYLVRIWGVEFLNNIYGLFTIIILILVLTVSITREENLGIPLFLIDKKKKNRNKIIQKCIKKKEKKLGINNKII